MVERAGRLEPGDDFWRFVFDPADGDPPVKLLPNAALEVLVRTARGTADPLWFVVFGEMTVFEDENYLFVRMAKRAGGRTPSDPVEAAPEAKPRPSVDPSRTVDSRSSSRTCRKMAVSLGRQKRPRKSASVASR